MQLGVGSSRNRSVFLGMPQHGTPREGSGSLSMHPVGHTSWCATDECVVHSIDRSSDNNMFGLLCVRRARIAPLEAPRIQVKRWKPILEAIGLRAVTKLHTQSAVCSGAMNL